MSVISKIFNWDGWANLFTGQGVEGRDRQLANDFTEPLKLDEAILQAIYRGDGFGRRVINLPADEMTRKWFTVTGDTENELVGYMKGIKTKKIFNQAEKWARLTGGAAVVMGIDDGGDFLQELNEEKIKTIEFLRVYDRFRITWQPTDIYTDPQNPKHGMPQFYTIDPISAGGVTSFKIHETRLLLFDGEGVTERQRQDNQGWGDSVLQAGFKELSNLGGAFFSSKGIIDEFILSVFKIDNLAELIAQDRTKEIKERLNFMDMSRHQINSSIIDGREDYERKSSSVAGLADLIDRFALAVSAVFGIPYTLLMGQSPAGMNSTGDSDIRFWYDKINTAQEIKLEPQVQRLADLIYMADDGPEKPENWAIDWVPLWQPTEKDSAETRKLQAETDQIYISNSVLDPVEVANSRFGGDTYSMETTLLVSPQEREKLMNEGEPEND